MILQFSKLYEKLRKCSINLVVIDLLVCPMYLLLITLLTVYFVIIIDKTPKAEETINYGLKNICYISD